MSNAKKPSLNDLFGEKALSQCSFEKPINKKVSMQDILAKNNSTDYDPFLKERGFTELINNADNKFKKDFAKTLISAESKVGRIDLPTIVGDGMTGIVRASETEKNIAKLMDYIAIKNQQIEKKGIPPVITDIEHRALSFNTLIEGKYEKYHIAFDVEADKYGHATQVSAVNWEAKRIVVAYYSDEKKLDHYLAENGWHYYILATDFLWEGVNLADYETLLAANLISNLEQGSKEVTSLYKHIFPELLENFIIDIEYLVKCLDNKAKGMWLCHNNRYDVNQLNANYMYKRGKRRNFSILKMKPAEFVTIRHDRQDLYKVRLGNSLIGFRFKIQSNTRYSPMHPYFQVNISPIQTHKFTMVEGVDTLNLAFAGQFKEKSLLALSKGLNYEKIELKDEKIFDKTDIEIIDGKIKEKMKYNLMDCFATLNVYAMLSYHFNLTETGKLQNVDLTITKDWHKSFAGSIISPATISKFIIQTILKKDTGLTIKEIENNFQITRQYLSNFKLTYKGGRTEGLIHGLIESIGNQIIKYLDFESQYPNSARLCQAHKQILLAAKGELHRFLDYNTKEIEKDFWETLKYTVESKQTMTPLEDSFAEKILGNVEFGMKTGRLTIRMKLSNRQQDIEITGNKDHRINVTLPDLLAACERAVLIDKVPIRKLKKRIKFINAERLNLGKTPAFGKELFTKIIIQRRPYQLGSELLGIMIKTLEKDELNWKQKLEIFQNKVEQLFTELIEIGIMGEDALTVITKAVKSVLENLITMDSQVKESIIAKNVDIKTILDSVKDNFVMPRKNIYNICEFIFQKFTKSSLQNLRTQFYAIEQQNKYTMNTAYGITAEGIAPDRDFTGKYQVPSVASLITAIARYLIMSAEILYTINNGLPIYTDTDSIPARATEETHKRVINYFSKTIRLNEERKFGKIAKFYVTGKKKYGIINEEGEIFTKIHGTGAYRDTKEFYKKLYQLKMTTDLPNEEIVKQCLPIHPIAQSVTYRSANDSKIKRMLGILKNGDKLREYQVFTGQSNLDLFVYKDKEDYLIINTKKLNKGMFGYYLNVERKSNSNLLIAIFAPCKFDEVLSQIIAIEKDSEIFTQIKYAKKSNERIMKIYLDLTPILDSLDVEVFIDPYTDTASITEEKYDEWNENYPTFLSFFAGLRTKYFKVLAEALKNTFNRLGNLRIDELTPENYFRAFSAFREEQITPDIFIEEFSRQADSLLPNNLKFGDRLVNEHEKFMFFGIKDRDESKILIKITEKTKLYHKFMKFLEFDRSRFHRKRIEQPSKTYDLMIPKTYQKAIIHKPIAKLINTEKFDNDGFDITYATKLPALDFSANLKSSETKYYSLAIQNICRHASVIFAKTHYSGIKQGEKIQEYLHETPYHKLPCPKGGAKNLNVLVPLKFQLKLPKNAKQISYKDFILIFDIEQIKKLVDRGVVHFDEKEKLYYILNHNKYVKALKQAYKYEWLEVEWLDRKWSITIEKRQNMDYNAMLSLKIHVGLDRLFQASLRINPSSRNFYNMELFETCLKELDEGTFIGKTILKKLFNGNILSFFDQNRATHLEDLSETDKPYEAFKITYLTIAHKVLKQKMPYLSSKIGIISYTKNIETKCPITDLIPLLESIKLKDVIETYEACKTESERINKMEEISVTRNRFSHGFNINDYRNKTTVSIYGKTYYQHLGKIKRMLYANNLKEIPKKPLTKLRHIKEYEKTSNILRLEITIRGWERIHTQAFYHYLDRLEDLIRRIDTKYYYKDENKSLSKIEFEQELKEEAQSEYKEINNELYHSIDEQSTTEAIKPEYYNKYDRVNSVNTKR